MEDDAPGTQEQEPSGEGDVGEELKPTEGGRTVEPQPAEDLESDPAHNPDDPELKRLQGG